MDIVNKIKAIIKKECDWDVHQIYKYNNMYYVLAGPEFNPIVNIIDFNKSEDSTIGFAYIPHVINSILIDANLVYPK